MGSVLTERTASGHMRTDSRIQVHLADLAVVADASQDRGLRLHCESRADVPAFGVMPAYAEARPLTAGYRQQAQRVRRKRETRTR
jgi:hypothetical protein